MRIAANANIFLLVGVFKHLENFEVDEYTLTSFDSTGAPGLSFTSSAILDNNFIFCSIVSVCLLLNDLETLLISSSSIDVLIYYNASTFVPSPIDIFYLYLTILM